MSTGDGKRRRGAADEVLSAVTGAVGGASRRLANGLKDLTSRPAPDDPDATDGAAGDDLGDRVRELGREVAGVMEQVTVNTGRTLRKAAFSAADTVRGVVSAARARRDD
ncbi:MAG TPA: hypothetical protein VML75_18315 [Kofleriaceae bacterium]|nr:hypothetical protein [Kofleriaceae bacterium]